MANAVMEAGVEEDISFAPHGHANSEQMNQTGIIITNPPYGERIGDK